MTISIGVQIVQALIFGAFFAAFFAALYYLIVGWAGWRPWIGAAIVLAGLCYVVLFGAVKL